MNEAGVPKKAAGLQVIASQTTLWGRFLEGDRQAFATIYHTHVDDLFHYGMHFCRNEERVKDCLQDIFQDLWQTRSHLTPHIQNIRYYLLSCLRRRLLRSLEKDRRWQPADNFDAFELEGPCSREEQLIDSETAAEQRRVLQEALASLTRRQREAIYLRFFQNLSYAEVAELMSMQVDSVYNTISKAIGILKKNLTLPLILILLKKM